VILLAVRWYLRFGLSYRDLEEILAERGIEVDHVTLYRWVQHFTPLLVDGARPCRHTVGDRWFVDETYVKVAGSWRYVYRAVDQHGQVIDVYLSQRRDSGAAPPVLHRRAARACGAGRGGDRLPSWRTSSPSSSPPHSSTPSGTPTTGSSVTTADSSEAEANAWTEDRPERQGDLRGPCLPAEPASWPL
jgi:hypothetical protein